MIEDFKNTFVHYRVFDDGRNEPMIYSELSKRYLNPTYSKNGYKQISVRNAFGEQVTLNFARFLLILTQPKDSYEGWCVDHINRDKTDDRLSNLRWISYQENALNRMSPKRPHRDVPIVIEYDDGNKIYYTHRIKDQINIPYITIYNLATAKEGKHYSPKYGIKCYYSNTKITNK